MSEVLKKFGRYFLLDRVAQGGMAEIYRARLASTTGPSRLLVIKRIQQGFGGNQEFVQMFKSETEVTMGFNHPNIVQVYDFGEEQEQPYIAMEFVDGRSLRQFLSRFNEIKQSFPVDLAAYITEQAAAGLQYAHAYKDKISGEPLNIVHRDISPQNILISYEGNVKVIDFGIAKASNNGESTRAGIIKGKPSYLSPEQITGESLDGRCDIFALGTVLWELLTGRKLFSGENDLQVLKMIESAATHVKAPSTVNPEIPKELDYVVLKSLAKQREQRYQTAEEFRRALHKFIYAYNPDFNPADLAYYAKDLFKNDIVEDRKKIQRLNEKAEGLLQSGRDGDTSSGEVVTGGSTVATGKKEDTTTVFDSKGAPMQSGQNGVESRVQTTSRSHNRAPNGRPQEGTRATRTSGSVNPGSLHRTGMTGGVEVSRTRVPAPTTSGGGGGVFGFAAAVLMAVAGAAYMGPQYGIEVPVLSAYFAAKTAGIGKLILKGEGKNLRVLVDGKVVASELPASVDSVVASRSVSIEVDGGAAGNFSDRVLLNKGETKTVTITLVNSASSMGHGPASTTKPAARTVDLKFKFTPAEGAAQTKITLNSKVFSYNDALAIPAPVDAALELVIERPGFKSIVKNFFIDAKLVGTRTDYPLELALEPVKFGFLTIRTTPSSDAFLTLRDGSRDPSSEKPINRQTPFENEKFPVGTYHVRLVNELLGMEKTVTVTVQEGRSFTIDERLELKH